MQSAYVVSELLRSAFTVTILQMGTKARDVQQCAQGFTS
jgi:hypothetical protein